MPFLFPHVKQVMKRFRDPDRSYRVRLKIMALDVSAAPGVKTLQFTATVQSEKKSGFYTTIIRFFDVALKREKLNTQWSEIKVGEDTFFYQVPSIKRNGVQIYCSCEDFRFNFSKQNYDAGGLIGQWKRYIRKTPPKKRPSFAKNPNPLGKDFKNADIPDGNNPGYCKHINALLLSLYKTKEVKN